MAPTLFPPSPRGVNEPVKPEPGVRARERGEHRNGSLDCPPRKQQWVVASRSRQKQKRREAEGERLQEGLRGRTPCPPSLPLTPFPPLAVSADGGTAGPGMRTWRGPRPLLWEPGAVAGQLHFGQRLWADRCGRAEGTARVPLRSPLCAPRLFPLPKGGRGQSPAVPAWETWGGGAAVRRGRGDS